MRNLCSQQHLENKKSELMLMRCARAYSSSWLQVSWSISIHMVAINLMQPKVDKKDPQNPYFGVQGQSRSWMLIPLKSTSPVPIMISSMFVPICNRFHAGQANIGKITTFYGVPLFDTCVRRSP